jgi:hypothetical protein
MHLPGETPGGIVLRPSAARGDRPLPAAPVPAGVAYDRNVRPPVILFGAFDRHNFGDLLFPHIAAALLPGRQVLYAGLAERDLRAQGGHAVHALSRWTGQAAQLIHVGGETLTCSAWQAAVMLLPPGEAQATIAYLEAHPALQDEWVRRMVGRDAQAPYVVSRRDVPGVTRVVHAGVGGVDLDRVDAALREEVLGRLAEADAVGVRDEHTLAHLAAAGIAAQPIPDPAALVAELFGALVHRRARGGEVARVLHDFPDGYLAVQFGAEFGDDDTLARIATQLAHVAVRDRLGVVLFRAGAAPWHDDPDALARIAARLPAGVAHVFESLDLWDLCALIAMSRGFCGSSLHGRIVAMAFALPRVNVRPAAATHIGKHAAYAATWDTSGMPGLVDADDIAAALEAASTVPERSRRDIAGALAESYRNTFAAIVRGPRHT